MRLIAILCLCLFLFLPVSVNAADDAEALFKQAEEMEWGNAGGTGKEINEAYEKAAKAGDPNAILYFVHIKKYFDHGKPEELKNVWCPQARKVVEKLEDGKTKKSENAYQLALYYSNEACVNRDMAKSLGYAMLAARKGSGKAMGSFGKMERGILKNEEAAFSWFEKAAKADSWLGKVYLAGCYFGGLGVEKDPQKAEDLVKEVASSKNMNAVHMMALKFLDGADGFPKDQAKGRELLEIAAANKHELAIGDLKDLQK